jgi:hypothetical protein
MTVLTAVVSGLITKDTKHMQIDDHPSCHHRLVRTIRTYFLQSTRTGHLGDMDKVWFCVRAAAGLKDVRLHDLRLDSAMGEPSFSASTNRATEVFVAQRRSMIYCGRVRGIPERRDCSWLPTLRGFPDQHKKGQKNMEFR